MPTSSCLEQWIPFYQDDPEGFYSRVRADGPFGPNDDVYNAARFIFINKTGFNGLYRVNKQGKCNTPWGQNPNARFYDIERLQQCAAILNDDDDITKTIAITDENALDCFQDLAVQGALVYIDPPYLPVSATSNFTAYTKDGFNYLDHIKLLNAAISLRERGAHIIVSLGSGPLGDELVSQYDRCGFLTFTVQSTRSINSDGKKRGNVTEYIITS
jgi:DNA adenine methylase